MEDLFEFNNAARGASHQSYNWLGNLSELVYKLELLGALVFLCWVVYCIPVAAEFLRRVAAFVSAPPFVFVFFNAVIVIIALSVKFGVFSASARENVGSDEEEKEEEEVQQLLLPEEILPGNEDDPGKSFFQYFDNITDESLLDKNVVIEDKEVILCEEKSGWTPTATRTPTPMIFENKNENENENENENPVDELSCEEFNKKIDSFIEDMRSFRRQEYWLESLKENNRTSIAIFD